MSVQIAISPKESIYEKAYAGLNTAQRQAVDTIEGPVMVVAGPGTGKTQTLAVRVARILQKTQARPSNILCLTFSLSGAKAMRERLRTMIGPDAYAVMVNTVHGFCNDLIQKHPEVFEDFKTLQQVSDIERLRIVRRALEKLPAGAILRRPTIERDRAGDILGRIMELKREAVSPDDLRRFAALYKEEIKFSPTGKERKQDSKAYKDDLRKVQQCEECADVYASYLEEMESSQRYDYEDMILVTMKALKEHEWLLEQLQMQYQYLLVDEFQDLNGAQNALIDLLISFKMIDHDPNIFVVGDDDQAIYRFQGANIGNMLSFLKRFPTTTVITLTENYRSHQEILNHAAAVINHNNERLSAHISSIQKTLHAAHGSREKPILLRYPDTEIEKAAIADILKTQHHSGTDWKEMAVLCRRNAEVEELYETLRAAGVPADIVAKQNLLTHESVLQIVTVLRAITLPDNDVLLSDALALPSFDCKPQELGRVWVDARDARKEKSQSLRAYLLRSDAIPENVREAFLLIEDLHQKQASTTLPQLVEQTLRQSNILPSKDDENPDPHTIAALHAFYDYVKRRAYEQIQLSLHGLLEDIDQYLAEPQLKLEYQLPHLTSDGVQLMTAHNAKGLEFDVVIMAHTRYRNWGNRPPQTGLALPDHLIYGTKNDLEKNASQEDERRLFYVAATRAKKKLFLTFPESYRSGEQMREAQVSLFVAEAGDTLDEKDMNSENIPSPIETLMLETKQMDGAFEAFIRERLENYQLSVTALNTFIKDPLHFLWYDLLKKPQAKLPHLSYGTAVHHALEKRNLAWKNGQEHSTEQMIADFEEYLRTKELLTQKDVEEYLVMGKTVLERYIQQTEQNTYVIHSAERKISAHLDDIPLTGKIDRIDLFEPNARTCRVLDYKTGRPKKTEDAVRKDENLFRQIVFYKILCDRSPSIIHEAELFAFDFIGNDTEDRSLIELKVTQAEVQELEQLIKKVWEKIMNLDFTPLEAKN